MSETIQGIASPAPAGRGSTEGGGGGDVQRPGHAAATSTSPVTNQTLLALDGHVYQHLSAEQSFRLTLIQLEFAQEVSSRAAAAYGRIITELRGPADRT